MARRYNQGRVYKQPGCANWYLQFNANGKTVRVSSGTTNKTIAQQMLRHRMVAADKGMHVENAHKITVGQLIDEYIKAKENEGIRSLRNYKQNKHYLDAELGTIPAAKLSAAAIEAYKAKRLKDPVRVFLMQKDGMVERDLKRLTTRSTINRELALLKAAFHHAAASERVSRVPYFKMFSEKDRVRKNFLDPKYYPKLSAECRKEGLWFETLFELYYSFGWRKNEPLKIRVSQVQGDCIRLIDSKNGEGTEDIQMPTRLATMVKMLITKKKPTDLLFTRTDGSPVGDFKRLWATATRNAGLSGLKVHDLRRTAARNLRNAGVSVSETMATCGWKSLAMMQRYQIVDAADRKRVADKLDAFQAQKLEAEPITIQ